MNMQANALNIEYAKEIETRRWGRVVLLRGGTCWLARRYDSLPYQDSPIYPTKQALLQALRSKEIDWSYKEAAHCKLIKETEK